MRSNNVCTYSYRSSLVASWRSQSRTVSLEEGRREKKKRRSDFVARIGEEETFWFCGKKNRRPWRRLHRLPPQQALCRGRASNCSWTERLSTWTAGTPTGSWCNPSRTAPGQECLRWWWRLLPWVSPCAAPGPSTMPPTRRCKFLLETTTRTYSRQVSVCPSLFSFLKCQRELH